MYSLVSIILACSLSSYFLAEFMREHVLRRYALVIHEFVQSVADIENAAAVIAGRVPAITDAGTAELFRHLTGLPETLRANIYDREQRIVWSSDRELIGRHFGANEELVRALSGQLEVESGTTGKAEHPKQEHMFLGDGTVSFIEIYMPVRDSRTGEVIGVAEIYRIPHGLFQTIRTGTGLIWLFGAGTALFLFTMQFWIVRRAHDTILIQQERLVETETLAVLGEMGAAVAHGIRNPLASIRSSAELWQDDPGAHGGQAAADIIGASDKIEKWLRDLLTYSPADSQSPERVDLKRLANTVLERFSREFDRRHIAWALHAGDELPCVSGHQALFEQVLSTLVTNSLEAMPNGGRISVTCALGPRSDIVQIVVADTGIGMTKSALEGAFRAFYTTKPKGMGLGLALVRRIVGRYGGRVRMQSQPGEGATVTLEFAASR